MTANYVLLERIELNATTTTITFNNIPQTGYTDLKFVMSLRATTSSSNDSFDLLVNLNGSAANKTQISLRGDGSGVNSNTNVTDRLLRLVNPSDYTSNVFSNVEFYVYGYTANQYKLYKVDGVLENNATSTGTIIYAGTWASNSAITSMSFTPNGSGANFTQYSSISLYGVAASGTTPVIAPKASGGNITTDGTYWYHTFLSTNTFTPNQALNADILVVAGGGAGGSEVGGGGGAGGLLTFTSQSLTATGYTCTVGAGAAQSSGSTNGSNGSNSQFGALTATIGGGGGTYFGSTTGISGGSGGGGGRISTGGAGTSGQGYAGARGWFRGNGEGGGGGGAGAAGNESSTANVGGIGGTGLTSSFINAIGAATGTGVLNSGNYYFAGGGGGGNEAGGSQAAGGVGGGGAGGYGAGGSVYGSPATINTGGGGGGGQGTSTARGGAGGSGIIVIRYAMA